MRHFPQRFSRLAHWSMGLAVFGMAVAIAGVLLGRSTVLPPAQGLIVLSSGLALAALAFTLAIAAYVDIWRSGAIGLKKANGGLVLSALVLAYPAMLVVTAFRLPAIHDISTDLKDLPTFSRSRAALEARAGHLPPDTDQSLRDLQRTAYPETVPIVLELGPEEAYQLALQAAQRLRWRVIDRAPPSVRSGIARIDAMDRTALMRFNEDVAIRIRPVGNQTRIDIRSVSRIKMHDLGSNAARIRLFSDTVLDLNKGA